MNPTYFGDSYDIVKRFFCGELCSLGYEVYAQPMFTGEWNANQNAFLRFVGVREFESQRCSPQSALLIDPDTGVGKKASRKHVSFAQLADAAKRHALVVTFDRSFSRQHHPTQVMNSKLAAIREYGCHGIYYDSHARFLFVSKATAHLLRLREHLLSLGLPESRLVADGA